MLQWKEFHPIKMKKVIHLEISQIVSSNILHAIKCSLRHLLGNDVSLKATYVKASRQHKRSEYSRDISKNMLGVHYSTDGCSGFFQE